MDGFSELKRELAENGIDVVASSSDEQDKAQEFADKYDFPVGYGVDQGLIESVGGYWQAERKFAQPSEFVLAPDGKIAMVSYSDGPLARVEAGDVIKMVNFLKSKS